MMKSTKLAMVVCLVVLALPTNLIATEGWKVSKLYVAEKAFKLDDKGVTKLLKWAKEKLNESGSSTMTMGDTAFTSNSFEDDNGNTIEVEKEVNKKTKSGTVKIMIKGTQEFVKKTQAQAK